MHVLGVAEQRIDASWKEGTVMYDDRNSRGRVFGLSNTIVFFSLHHPFLSYPRLSLLHTVLDDDPSNFGSHWVI